MTDYDRPTPLWNTPTFRSWFRMDRAGFRDIAMGVELAASVRDIAERRAKPFAVSISPVDTGDYKRSFKVNMTTWVSNKFPMTRVAADLYNDSVHVRTGGAYARLGGGSYAKFVEVGSKKQPAHHVMRKTLAFLDSTGGVPASLINRLPETS